MAQIWIPALLRELAGGQQTVEVAGESVLQVIDSLEERYPGIKARLCAGDRLQPSLTVAVDGEVSPLGLRQPVKPNSEIHFLPVISGGMVLKSHRGKK